MNYADIDWFRSKRVQLIENVMGVDSYEEFLENNVRSMYSYTDEYGPFGHCLLVDKNSNVYDCEFEKGMLNSEMIVVKYDELVGIYQMKDGKVVQETDLSHLRRNQIQDLSDENEYSWEGDILGNQPCGWGEVFDSQNHLVYVGFRVGGVNVCFGTVYYPTIGVVMYEGHFCRGKRWGFGRSFLQSGAVEYEGIWLNDQRVCPCKQKVPNDCIHLIGLHSLIEELEVGEECCNGSLVFSLHHYVHLRVLCIAERSFSNVRRVRIQSNWKLEQISLGSHVFETVEEAVISGMLAIFSGYRSSSADTYTHERLVPLRSIESQSFKNRM